MPDIRLAGTPQDYTAFTGGTYTANTGNNRLVVAVVGYEYNTAPANPSISITLGSVAFTIVHWQTKTSTGGNAYGASAIGYIREANIPTGSQSITVTANPSSTGSGPAITLYTLENVDQLDPIFDSYIKDISIPNTVVASTISAPAGGFAIHVGTSSNPFAQPFSITDTTWTERRDYRNTATDFGFFIYDKLYTANKTENLTVTGSTASSDYSIITCVFNPHVSNKIRFDTSANGYSYTAISNGSTTATTITANVPTNVIDGDMIVAIILNSNGSNPGSISTPAGWTVLANNSATNGNFGCHMWVGYKIANNEPSSYTWNIIAVYQDDVACIFRVPGYDKRNPIESIGTVHDQFSISPTINNLTTSNTSTAFYVVGAKNGNRVFAANNSFVSPNNSTQAIYTVSRAADSEGGVAFAVAYEDIPIGKTISGKQFDNLYISAGGSYNSTFAFAIKQAPYSTVQAERLVETGKVKRFTDDFNRADTAVGDLGPNWDIIIGPLRIINNQYDAGLGTINGSSDTAYAKVTESIADFSDDHSAQITVTRRAVFDPIGPAVRVTTNGCYALNCDGGNDGIRRISYVNGRTVTSIGSANIPIANGDILKITAQGSVITAYKNGVQVDQVSNTAYTTGQPGIFYSRGNINTSKGDDFIAEDLNSPTSGTMVKMFDDGTIQAGYFSEKEYLDRIKYHFDGDVWAGKFIESE